jgi:hypothetical protein
MGMGIWAEGLWRLGGPRLQTPDQQKQVQRDFHVLITFGLGQQQLGLTSACCLHEMCTFCCVEGGRRELVTPSSIIFVEILAFY